MKLWVGTSGYSYKEWKGEFYPETLPAAEMLRFYASRLPAVEINNTFYRMPAPKVLESWASQVPENFRFALKASQRITHMKRLKEAEQETGYLLRTAATLGARLGVILFQLPPNMRKDLPRLETFLDFLAPEETPAAFEFRHASWFEPDVFEALGARGAALCMNEAEEGGLDVPLARTASWGYLRLRRQDYTDADLEEWARRIREQQWDSAYVFFKHEDEPTGPLFAARFLELAARAQ